LIPIKSWLRVNHSRLEKQPERGNAMYATIRITPYIHVQGPVLRRLPDGLVAVGYAGRQVVGEPMTAQQGAEAR
jgi:hypothetical protein